MGERKKRIGGTGMKWYAIGKTLTPLDRAPESGAAVGLLNSDEILRSEERFSRNARTAARPQGRHAPLLRLSRDEGPRGAGG